MPSSKDNRGAKSRLRLRCFQVLVLALLIVLWHVLTSPTLLPPIYFAEANQAAFFFGEPIQAFWRLWRVFPTGGNDRYPSVAVGEPPRSLFIRPACGPGDALVVPPGPHTPPTLGPHVNSATRTT